MVCLRISRALCSLVLQSLLHFPLTSDTCCPRGTISSISPKLAIVESLEIKYCTLVAVKVGPAMIMESRALWMHYKDVSRQPPRQLKRRWERGSLKSSVWMAYRRNPMIIDTVSGKFTSARVSLTGRAPSGSRWHRMRSLPVDAS